jgi:hypothetical protein
MKKSFLVVLLLSIFILPSIASAGERPKDFRGLVWGTHISKVEGLVLHEEPLPTKSPGTPEDLHRRILETINRVRKEREERGEKKYIRPSDDLKVAGGKVDIIEYVFIKDQLAEVIMRFKDYGQYLAFKSLLSDLYGAPDKEEKERGATNHYWYAKTDDEANVNLFFSDQYGIKAGSLLMKSKASTKKKTGL